MRRNPHLSSSSINDYIDCGLFYKFGRIDRSKREFTADSLEFGTTIHRVLADVYQGKMLNSPLDLKEVLELFKHYWAEGADDNDEIMYAGGKDFKSYLIEGQDLLTHYFNKVPDDKYIPTSRENVKTSPAFRYNGKNIFTAQVNVNQDGENICLARGY